ncbi:hypothetical protein B0H11DRAFT_2299756 [Mycena galericulata]|nr:hypothetical protein B0H11DRAFT_2299756 [Mycena galericulata]
MSHPVNLLCLAGRCMGTPACQAVPARRALGLAAPREGGWITITTRHQTRTGWAMWAAHGPASGTARQRRDEGGSEHELPVRVTYHDGLAVVHSPDSYAPTNFGSAGHIAANVAQTLLTRHPAALEVQWDRVLHYAPCARLWQARRSMGLSSYLYTGQVAASAIGSESLSLGYLPGGRHRRHLAQLHWNVMVKTLRSYPAGYEAFKIATSGRPGPVPVDLSKDVTVNILRAALPFKQATPATPRSTSRTASYHLRVLSPPPPPFGPVLLAQLAERGNIPVCTALQGLSAFDETHEKSLHTRLRKAEVIIALGSRFNDRVTMKVDQFASGARAAAAQGRGGIIHFEILPKNVNKVASMPMPSPAYTSASSHIARLAPRTLLRDPSEYLPLARARVRPVCPPLAPRPSPSVSPAPAVSLPPPRLAPAPPPCTPSPPRALRYRPRSLRRLRLPHARCRLHPVRSRLAPASVSPVPAAVSPRLASRPLAASFHPVPSLHPPSHPHVSPPTPASCSTSYVSPRARRHHGGRRSFYIDGDASFSMTAMELATAFQFRIAVKVLVLNNEFQGMMQQWQDGLVLLGALSHSHTRRMTNPDFVLLAQAMGVHALRCETAADLPVQMAEFLAYDNNK